MNGASQRSAAGYLDPEKVAYWYFRLNGFFQIENFVVHRQGAAASVRTPTYLRSAFRTVPSGFSTIQTTLWPMTSKGWRFHETESMW